MSGSGVRRSMDRGWVIKPGEKRKRAKLKKIRYATPEEAEKDRKFRTGVRVGSKSSYRRWNDEADTDA